MPIVGIDLGTTNSLVSVLENGIPVIIPNSHGEPLTPSVVSIGEGGEIFVGHIAQAMQITNPLFTVAVFKRSMGTKKEFILGDTTFTPEVLSSFVLKKLKEDAEAYLKTPVTEAIISVPAYFNDAQRRATKLAGELAGFVVERIVNEPTAASLAYGFHEAREYAKYLVFDLGGGTFDVSILEKYKNIMEVRAVAGDVFLGGEDFTDVLMEMFLHKTGLVFDDLSPTDYGKLRKQTEEAKQRFSESRSITISIEEKDEATFTLDQYEKACEPLLNRLRIPIKKAISDAALRLSDIDAIILAGGATKLPIVRKFAAKLFGKFPRIDLNPDEVVALGAAIHAGLKERDETIAEVVLTDVCPFTLGIDSVVKQPNGLNVYDVFLPIIERNSTIPISRVEQVFTLHEQQNQIHIQIYQGESRHSSENAPLGELTVPIPKGPAGQEGADVRFTYDINGILECEVTILSTKLKRAIIIEKNPGIFTQQEIDEKMEILKAYKLHPREKDEYRLLLERGERLYREKLGETRRYIGTQLIAYEQILNTQDEGKIRTFIPEFKDMLTHYEKGGDFV